jgi:hypothetical protein
MRLRARPLRLALAGAGALGAIAATTSCDPEQGPTLALTLNAVPAPLNALLVVPPSGFVVNVSFTPRDEPVAPGTFSLLALPWDGSDPVDLGPAMSVTAAGAVGVVPAELALPVPNTYSLIARVDDTGGGGGVARYDFAARSFPNGPPIGFGQLIWYDFEVDRDGNGSPDFPDDLAALGLASPLDPDLSAQVQDDVIDRLVDRVKDAYWDQDPNGIGQDPVWVSFLIANPAALPSTRICVGGVAPGSPSLIGSILIDPGNANRTSVECGSLPPTGVFPRGLLAWAGNYHFQAVFDPLMTSRGGTPVGEHPLDPIVLDPGFDPDTATPEELARFDDVETAVQVYADALGSIVAHETGHALGLVQPGAPGLGLHGGTSGDLFAHDVNPDGSVPAENFLMKGGSTVKFQHVAGLAGNPLPFFRPLDLAYLRDRAVIDSNVTALLTPPDITSASPTLITASGWLNAYGSGFASPPRMRLVNETYAYELISESLVSATHVRGLVSLSQIPAGIFALEVWNPDGQLGFAPVPIVIQK